jgi:cobalt-zinc-cadmium efflux system membrane fusion protein
MKKKFFYIVILTLLLSCNNRKDENTAEQPTSDAPLVELNQQQFLQAGIQMIKPELKETASFVTANGKTEAPPQHVVSVSAPFGGFIKSTTMVKGMPVKKGQTMAIMEDQQYIQLQQDFLVAKAQAVLLENEFNRQKELNQNKTSSDKVFEKAQTDYWSNKITLKALSEKLRLMGLDPEKLNEKNISGSMVLAAPIDGFVSEVFCHTGKYVSPQETIFQLINPDNTYLSLKVFERQLNQVAVGYKVYAYAQSNPEVKYEGVVQYVGKDISAEGTVAVHCQFLQADKRLIPGMYMNAEIISSGEKAYLLPDEAIVRYQGKTYVFEQVADRQFKMLEVTSKSRGNGTTQVEFTDGVVGEKNIVVKGAYTLLMHLKNKDE